MTKRLDAPRRCHYYVEGLPFEQTAFERLQGDRACPNYVNMKKPRRVYWGTGQCGEGLLGLHL